MRTRKNNLKSGFTLIEVIITLVVVAVAAAMMAVYFGTLYTQSSVPISRLVAAGNLNQIMERITADYNNEPATWSPGTTYATTNSSLGTALPTVILPTEANRNGYRYICTNAGTSGTTEPTWNNATISGSTVTEPSGLKWTYGGFTPPTNWIANMAYPLYAVVYPTNGYQYQCTAVGTSGNGVSGTSAPTWRTDSTPFTDGTGSTQITWTWKGLQPTLALQAKIGAEVAGGKDYTQTFSGVSISYRVIQNRFITFASNTENDNCTPSSCNMSLYGVNTNVYGKYLKVTIGLPMAASPRTADTLTTLFIRR
jgi:prepilin-type N-terminal cleavage/methylation domain-containing protein